ncbi:hypothetical protein PRJ39_04700 [Lysobacter enzymogenes]|uniref:hypothetical protein n=1 Tax=Lysobacter enzymogenes TaxID=69 RepID=UPI003748FA79
MKKVLGILGAVVAFVALLIAMAIGKLAGRSAISQYNEAKQDQALADVLVNVNRGLPKMVDAMTRID